METDEYVLWMGSETSISEEKLSLVYSSTINLKLPRDKGLSSSYYALPVQRIEMKILNDEYVCVMESICNHLNVRMDGFDYWTQIYDGGHTAHNHEGYPCAVCFTHFIEPIGSFFYFVAPNGEKVYPKQERGDIIAFSPSQMHGIDPSYGNQRMVIAGNILSYGN